MVPRAGSVRVNEEPPRGGVGAQGAFLTDPFKLPIRAAEPARHSEADGVLSFGRFAPLNLRGLVIPQGREHAPLTQYGISPC